MKALILLVPALIMLSACTQVDPATASLEKKLTMPIGGSGSSAPPNRKPHPQPALTLTGDQNEGLLNGQTVTLSPSQVVISKTSDEGREFETFAFKGDHTVAITFSSPHKESLAVGLYDYVREVRQEFPRHAGLTITVDGKSTASVNARFQIVELVRDTNGTVTSFAADFQAIDGHVAGNWVGLTGAIRLNSTKPVPSPIAVAANPDTNNTLPSSITVTSGQNSSGVTEAQGDFAIKSVKADGGETLTLQFAANYPSLNDLTFTYTASPSVALGMVAAPAASLSADLGQCSGPVKNLNVLELERNAEDHVTKFSANFDLVCDGGAVQKGYLRYHSILAF